MRRAIMVLIAMACNVLAEHSSAVISRPVVNLFSKPTSDADIVSQAIFGWNVEIVESEPAWLKVRTPDDYTGWIEAAGAAIREPYAVSGTVAKVRNLFASVYRERSITKHQPVLTLPFEARLEVLEEWEQNEARWIQVRLPDTRTAWVQRGDLTLATGVVTREEMLTFSRRFVGLPYLWGGTSTYGFDCSGFTQMLFRQIGVTLPRDAQPQAEWAGLAPTAPDDLRPGDLLYFGSSDKKITHTGLFLGDDEFIHATAHNTPVVQISRLSDPHWTELLVATRRLK